MYQGNVIADNSLAPDISTAVAIHASLGCRPEALSGARPRHRLPANTGTCFVGRARLSSTPQRTTARRDIAVGAQPLMTKSPFALS